MLRLALISILLFSLLFTFDFSAYGSGAPKTVVKDAAAKARLLGDHRFSMQWISWDYFGSAKVTDDNGTLKLKAVQKSRQGSDYVSVEGIITAVEAKQFTFQGTILTKVEHIANGQECKREGEYTFHITQNRRYWRLKEMQNPCEEVVDYIDIYFRKGE